MQRQCVIVAALITLIGCAKQQEPSIQTQAGPATRPSQVTAPAPNTAPATPVDPVAALAAKLANGAPGDRAKAAEAIGALGDKGKPATPALCAAMLDKDDDLKVAAGDALKKVRPDLHPWVTELALGKDKDVFATNQAMNALLQLGPKGRESWPVVVRYLRYLKAMSDKPPRGTAVQDWQSRMQDGIWFLERSGAGEEGPAFDLLLELAGNPDVIGSSVANACTALGVVGQNRQDLRAGILPALLAALQQLKGGSMTYPIVALGKLGPDAKEAVPALRKLTLHEDAGVRKAAGDALARIEGGK